MKLLYEEELLPYLNVSPRELLDYAQRMISSHNASNFQRVNELSYLLRRNRRHEEAVQIAQMMYEDFPSADRLNLYFVAAVDQGDISKIRDLSNLTDAFVLENGYQRHLFATWLKAANKILDNELFERIYAMVPDEEKLSNSYIISQYYVYKNRRSQYSDVCEHYSQLPRHMQEATFVKRYYENARARMGYSTRISPLQAKQTPYASEILPGAVSLADNMSNFLSLASNAVRSSITNENPIHQSGDSNQKERQVFLVYGGTPANLSVIEALLSASRIRCINTIIEAFEKQASLSDFAIVLCTPDNEGINGVWYPRMNVVFEYGYFMAKLGRRNVCLMRSENGKKLELPSDFNSIYQISMDKPNWVSELGQALRSAGYNAAF